MTLGPLGPAGRYLLVLKLGYCQAGIVAVVSVYRVLPESITEVKQIEPIAHILLLSDGYQVIGEYPDACPPASPEDYYAGDIVQVRL